MKKRAVLVALWVMSCVACLAAGYVVKLSAAERTTTTTEAAGGKWHIRAIDRLDLGEEINVSKGDLVVNGLKGDLLLTLDADKDQRYVRSLTFFDDSPKIPLLIFFYPKGRVKAVQVKGDEQFAHGWGFYENGALQYRSAFKNRVETRQYFDLDGKPTETKTIEYSNP